MPVPFRTVGRALAAALALAVCAEPPAAAQSALDDLDGSRAVLAPPTPGPPPGFPTTTPPTPGDPPDIPTTTPPTPGEPPPDVPLDGGLGLLVLAGAGYAARRLRA